MYVIGGDSDDLSVSGLSVVVNIFVVLLLISNVYRVFMCMILWMIFGLFKVF